MGGGWGMGGGVSMCFYVCVCVCVCLFVCFSLWMDLMFVGRNAMCSHYLHISQFISFISHSQFANSGGHMTSQERFLK